MEFYDVIEARRSVRGYLDKNVPDEAVAKISRAVQLAPTACNRQPFQLFLFRDPAIRAKICEKVMFPWLKESADRGRARRKRLRRVGTPRRRLHHRR